MELLFLTLDKEDDKSLYEQLYLKLKQELIDILMYYGFKVEINIDLVLEGDEELKEKIEQEKEKTINFLYAKYT